jgi:hypothetical protein
MTNCYFFVFMYHLCLTIGITITYFFVPFIKNHILIICAITIGISIIGILTYSIHLCTQLKHIVNKSHTYDKYIEMEIPMYKHTKPNIEKKKSENVVITNKINKSLYDIL